jgi:acylphosphatase
VIHGRVQGVFFRDAVRVQAVRNGVAGWVANRDDGTVEAWLEGDAAAVATMLAWCEDGPKGAAIDRVDVEAVEAQDLTDFVVR